MTPPPPPTTGNATPLDLDIPALLDPLPDMVAVVDDVGIVRYANAACEAFVAEPLEPTRRGDLR